MKKTILITMTAVFSLGMTANVVAQVKTSTVKKAEKAAVKEVDKATDAAVKETTKEASKAVSKEEQIKKFKKKAKDQVGSKPNGNLVSGDPFDFSLTIGVLIGGFGCVLLI